MGLGSRIVSFFSGNGYAEELEENFHEVVDLLGEELDIDIEAELQKGNLEYPRIEPEETEVGDSSVGSPVSYNETFNVLHFNPDYIEEHGYEIDHTDAAAEAMHWLRESLFVDTHDDEMDVLENLVKNPQDASAEKVVEVNQFNTQQFRYNSVEEFFDRIGQRLAAEEFGYELNDWSSPDTSHTFDWTDGDMDYGDLRSYFTHPDVLQDEFEAKVNSELIHYAGYNAADQNFEEVRQNPEVISNSREEIHEEYNMAELEEEYLRDLFDL
ncbi:MAG: hypothetical protein ABEK16_06440 [Candidatus Nanohalobium sp.]